MDAAQRIECFACAGRPVEYRRGEVVLHEGEEGDHCVAIIRGDLLVTTSSSTGATVVLARRRPGDFIGELSLLDGVPRSARVVATTDVEARRMNAQELEQLLLSQPDLALEEIRRLAAEVRSLSRRVTGRSEELRVRVLDMLHLQTEVTGEAVFRSTREELAGWVGATREAVSRTLTDLQAEGLVVLGRGQVRLLA